MPNGRGRSTSRFVTVGRARIRSVRRGAWRADPVVLLAAGWALVGVVRVRRQLRSSGVQAVAPRAPRLPERAGIGVQAVINRLSPTCVERALIWQSWLFAHGQLRDVVVGVPPQGMQTVSAHAWLDGAEPESAASYVEILRLPPGR